ncbi:unnamed protein product [Lepeophtheirus salmonis]|uniref:(salmon louse) hypothetical protein n=1 Tax=Lepeophtheirus salmonis TaxID=72036 RepID=A0A7R8CXM8_LEPSM|nr:unnamed protein product [Lepeophtheirus salmonis]CAF2962152.1 unnamed protein product [Lepeophtheirus salmonis]
MYREKGDYAKLCRCKNISTVLFVNSVRGCELNRIPIDIPKKDKRLFYKKDDHCNVDKSPCKVLDIDATFKYEGLLLNSEGIYKPDSIKVLTNYLDHIWEKSIITRVVKHYSELAELHDACVRMELLENVEEIEGKEKPELIVICEPSF